eukprot:m.1049216 g.1049216  ORF g.1049216 m.1049216 type:complete len:374 (-) comp24172_c0_seq76:3614-4735(-)
MGPFGGATMGVKEDIQWVKEAALLAIGGADAIADDADIARLHNDPAYIEQFLSVHTTKEVALEMLMTCLQWRKEFNVARLELTTDADVAVQESGMFFFHGKDKQGRDVAILRLNRLRARDADFVVASQRMIASVLDRYLVPGNKITLLLDLRGCGAEQHFNLEFCSFIANCFRIMFPNSIGAVLMLELPWKLQSVWSIVRCSLRATDFPMIHKVRLEDLPRFVSKDQLLLTHGGLDASRRTSTISMQSAQFDATSPAPSPSGLQTLSESNDMGTPMDTTLNSSQQHRSALRSVLSATSPRDEHAAATPPSQRKVTFAQLSPGPGEIPHVAIAAVKPPKELVFEGTPVADDFVALNSVCVCVCMYMRSCVCICV